MTFRPALPSDRGKIRHIISKSFKGWYRFWARKSFDSADNALVAEDLGKIAGEINWRVFDIDGKKIGYLFWLAVHPSSRRKGIGEGLARAALDILLKIPGLEDILSSVEKDNVASTGMLAKLGFTYQSRSEMRQIYGRNRSKLYRLMWAMPWEDVYRFSRWP